MQTLTPPTLICPELSTPSCEQVMPGNADEEQDGKLGSGSVEVPQPLQGGADLGDRDREKETGSEGDGP